METTFNHKSRLIWSWSFFRTYISESTLFSLLLFPFDYLNKDSSIMWASLGVNLFATILFLLVSFFSIQNYRLYFRLSVIPIMIGLSFLFNIHWILIIMMLLFIQWRYHTLLKEGTEEDFLDNKNTILLVTIFVGVLFFIIGKVYNFHYSNTIPVLILLQLTNFSYGIFLKRLFQSNQPYLSRIITIGTYIIALPTLCAVFLIALSDLLRSGILFVISLIFNVIGFLFTPLIKFIFDSGLSLLLSRGEKKEEIINSALHPNSIASHQKTVMNEGHSLATYIIFFVVLFIIVLWLLLKFRKLNVSKTNEFQNKSRSLMNKIVFKDEDFESMLLIFTHYSKANSEIRKSVESLEKYALKKNVRRNSSESARAWLNRIGVQASHHWWSLYESVRYGTREITKKEMELFNAETKNIKMKIKSISHSVKGHNLGK